MQANRRLAPKAPDNFPPDTEITFIPTPVNLATGCTGGKILLFLLLASAAGVGWWGAANQSRSNLSSRHDNAGIHADTQFNPTTVKPQSTPSPSFQLKNKTARTIARSPTDGYSRQILC